MDLRSRREHAFTRVDADPNPGSWIAVLERLGADPLYAPYKQRTLELLEPQPGGRYLEVGMGTGRDALTCARRFGVNVVGVDASHVLVAEARRRGLRHAVVADAHALPFPAAGFDGAWADRVFQHLAEPERALGEMVRVVRPGGRVVVVDPDYATQVVNVADPALAERVLSFRAERALRHGTLAHQMPRLFVRAGLSELRVEAFPVVVQNPAALDRALGLRDWARFARDDGLLEEHEVRAWERALDAAAADGSFRYGFSLFITAGRTHARA